MRFWRTTLARSRKATTNCLPWCEKCFKILEIFGKSSNTGVLWRAMTCYGVMTWGQPENLRFYVAKSKASMPKATEAQPGEAPLGPTSPRRGTAWYSMVQHTIPRKKIKKNSDICDQTLRQVHRDNPCGAINPLFVFRGLREGPRLCGTSNRKNTHKRETENVTWKDPYTPSVYMLYELYVYFEGYCSVMKSSIKLHWKYGSVWELQLLKVRLRATAKRGLAFCTARSFANTPTWNPKWCS